MLNFTQNQVNALVGDGFETAADVIGWTYKEVKDWCSGKTKLPLNRGGCNYGDLRVKSLQGLVWWCNDHHLRGKEVDLANEFDEASLVMAREEAKLDYEDSQQEAVIDKPGKFDPKKWHDWAESIVNYLNSMKNIRRIPLSYVIRVEPPTIPTALMDREQEIIYNAPLTGSIQGAHIKALTLPATNRNTCL